MQRETPLVLVRKLINKYKRFSAAHFSRKSLILSDNKAYISFTFDDFPISAYTCGGEILNKYGVKGTYYVSFGLLNKMCPSGKIADIDIVKSVVNDGHELGCHTYSHSDAWETSPNCFESSLIKNQNALQSVFPGEKFNTLSYPLGNATPLIKQISEKYFNCSRGGRQQINKGVIDLNNLNSFFIDKRKNETLENINQIIDENFMNRGWLIFVAHGVTKDSAPYSCDPAYFENIVKYATKSGNIIMPVNKVYEIITNQR
jgi:peptidoglycan/xylan/chitin deacetylase (PgdA/CDA1 family)